MRETEIVGSYRYWLLLVLLHPKLLLVMVLRYEPGRFDETVGSKVMVRMSTVLCVMLRLLVVVVVVLLLVVQSPHLNPLLVDKVVMRVMHAFHCI